MVTEYMIAVGTIVSKMQSLMESERSSISTSPHDSSNRSIPKDSNNYRLVQFS
jgi:hypothetical protein